MPYSARQVADLQAERTGDPLARGYAVMTDGQFLASLIVENRDNPRTSITAGELFESIDVAEFQALDAGQKTRVDRLLGLGAEIIIGPGNAHQAVSELQATFGGGSNTVGALQVVRDQKFSRVVELGLPVPILADIERTS